MFVIAFDAMWTVARVLNYTEEMRLQNISKSDPELEECGHLPGELVPLNKFNYSNAFMGCVIKSNYHKVNFTGVSVSDTRNSMIILHISYRVQSVMMKVGLLFIPKFDGLKQDQLKVTINGCTNVVSCPCTNWPY